MKRAADKQLSKEEVEKEEKEEEKVESTPDEKKKEETEEKKEEGNAPAFTFSFGASATTEPFNFSAGGAPTFSFGSTPAFSFGSAPSSGPFQFSFAPTKPVDLTFNKDKKEEEGEDDDPEKDLTTNDGPVIMKTLPKEDLVNGEEGEETVYSVPKMKLYELKTVEVKEKSDDEKEEKEDDKTTDEKKEKVETKKVWQERGLGVLRLNVDKKTHVARILIRREPTHQSMANFNIIHETKVTVDSARKSITIQTIEPETVEKEEEEKKDEKKDEEKKDEEKKDEEKKEEHPAAKISFYMIRVSTKEIAEELCAKINEHVPKKE